MTVPHSAQPKHPSPAQAHAPHTLEDALRDLVRNSPYLVASASLHLLVALLFLGLPARAERIDPEHIIRAERTPEPEPPLREEPTPPTPVEAPVPVESPEVVESPAPPDEVAAEASALAEVPFATNPTAQPVWLGVGASPGEIGGGSPLRGRGGEAGAPTVAAIERALRWLACHQAEDGRWSAAAFDAECGKQGEGTCTGSGAPLHDVGTSALALLAFLGAGHTPAAGDHRGAVKRGLRWLAQQQDTVTGAFGEARFAQHTYGHALATIAMIEAYEATRAFLYRTRANAGLAYLHAIRNPGRAWRYTPGMPEMDDPLTSNDTSVTSWAVLASALGRDAGLVHDEDALQDALAFLDEMTDPRTGRTGYMTRGGPSARERGLAQSFPAEESEALTAAAALVRIFADPDLERPGARAAVTAGLRLVALRPPRWDDERPGARDFYHWYYGTYALYQGQGLVDGAWRRWESALAEAVLAHQELQGEACGSWEPDSAWGPVGGRVYATALLTLCLEVHFRYPSVMGG